MSKKELAWLIVRLVGIGLLFNSLRYAFIVVENLLIVSQNDNGKVLLSQSSGLFTGWVIEAIVYGLLGFYFLFNGNLLYRLLVRESTGRGGQKEIIKNLIVSKTPISEVLQRTVFETFYSQMGFMPYSQQGQYSVKQFLFNSTPLI